MTQQQDLKMILRITLAEAIGGYWDGGAKKVFDWTVQGSPQRDSKGEFVKVGSWEANSWFMVALGKTEKQTLANARRKLSPTIKKSGAIASYEYILE